MKKPAQIQLDRNARTRRTQWKQVIQFFEFFSFFLHVRLRKKDVNVKEAVLKKKAKPSNVTACCLLFFMAVHCNSSPHFSYLNNCSFLSVY